MYKEYTRFKKRNDICVQHFPLPPFFCYLSSALILILILVAVVGALVALASVKTEVAPARVEKAMLNEAAAK